MAKSKLPSYPETISSEISLPLDGNKTFWMLRSYELPNNKVPPSGSARVAVPFAVLNSSARTIYVLLPQIQLAGASKANIEKR